MRLIKETLNDELFDQIVQFTHDWHSLNEIIVNTSGSTGAPKSIVLKKEYLVNSARNTLQFFDLKPGDNVLSCLSTETIAGKMMIIRAIEGELNLVVSDVKSRPLKDLKSKIHFAAMVPLQLEQSIRNDLAKVKAIDTIIVGGAAVSPDLIRMVTDHELNVFQTFGMTETMSHIAVRRLDGKDNAFVALPGVSFSTEDKRLVIHALQLGIAALKTNDIVELVDEKHFVWIGRSDFVINSGGIKLHPEQIEYKIAPLIQARFFSAGIPDQTLGEKLILCINATDTVANRSLLSEVLEKYELPKEVYFFDKFFFTESGKIDRKKTMEHLKYAVKKVL